MSLKLSIINKKALKSVYTLGFKAFSLAGVLGLEPRALGFGEMIKIYIHNSKK